MLIRKYVPSDCKELTELFYNTVHTVNANDYSKEQLDVWAPGKVDLDKWNRTLQEHYSQFADDTRQRGEFSEKFKKAFQSVLSALFILCYNLLQVFLSALPFGHYRANRLTAVKLKNGAWKHFGKV